MTPETRVKGKIKKMLKEIEVREGAFWFPISQRYHSGFPDFLLIREGRPIFIEGKAEGEDLRKLQSWTMKRIVNAGARYWIGTEKEKKLIILENGVEINEEAS